MTRHDDMAAAPEAGGRLYEAFAEEVDRPGLEGPALNAVLRAGAGRVRRRRAAFGATFAVAAAATVGVGTVVAQSGTGSAVTAAGSSAPADPAHIQAAGGQNSAPTTQTSTLLSEAGHSTAHPDAVVLASGTVEGHAWKLVREFTQVPKDSHDKADPAASPANGTALQWCVSAAVYVDGAKTNSGTGGNACVVDGKLQHVAPTAAEPGFSSIEIIDAAHERLGSVVVGEVQAGTAEVVARCGSKEFSTKPAETTAYRAFYYTFAFPKGSDCATGSLTFSDASGHQLGQLTGLALGVSK